MPEAHRTPAAKRSGVSSELFDDYLDSFYAQRNDLGPAAMERARLVAGREFAAHLPGDRNAPMLEIGCGCGALLLYLEAAGYTRVTGVDVSRQQVEFCRSQGLANVILADGLDFLRDSSERYEAVILSDVLEHLPKERALELLREIHRHLVPGGTVIARVPNLSNPLNLRTRYVDFTHEIGFTRESLDQVLRLTGFEVVEISGLFSLHRNPLARLVFDVILWRLFVLVSHHTLRLPARPVRGKNLLAVGRKPPTPSGGETDTPGG